MLRKTSPLLLGAILVLTIALPSLQSPARAQDGPDGTTSYSLNLRAGPGMDHQVITVLDAGTGMIFEGRNEDMSWLLGHTEDGALRGWVASLYLTFTPGFTAARLPLSDEIINYQPPAPAVPSADVPPPPAGDPPASGVAPTLEATPIVPGISSNVYAIFQRGQALGNNRNVFSKAGECNTMSHAFMVPFGTGQYNLGAYGQLQRTINFFTPHSFTDASKATGAGFTSATVVDPAWASPGCAAGLSPLECELERTRPSVVLVMLGTHDVYFLSTPQYEQAMRRIIEISTGRGVIPVLFTFPTWPGDYGPRAQKRIEFNTTLVNLSREYGVPLVNFWRAAQSVTHGGVGEDFVHLTERGDNWTDFNGEQNQWGFTMWNLVTLQTLDQLYVNVLSN
jgi:hypothetical protein